MIKISIQTDGEKVFDTCIVKNSNSKNWKSLQVQYQLPYYMDSEVSEKSLNWKGGICA